MAIGAGDGGPTVEASVLVAAPPAAVWHALTDLASLRAWMAEPHVGVEIETTWQVGTPIVVRGFHVARFENRGTVLAFQPESLLCYSHLSSLSRLPDVPQNHAQFEFRLTPVEYCTRLDVTVRNPVTEAILRHLEFYFRSTLPILRRQVEATVWRRQVLCRRLIVDATAGADGAGGHVYLLDRDHDGRLYYRDIGRLPAVDIYFYEMDRPPDPGTRRELPAPSLRIERVGVNPDPGAGVRALSPRQFDALYSAVAGGAAWWPTADGGWDARGLFARLRSYALFDGTMPIGLCSLEASHGGARQTKIVYFGLIPSAQGKGIGGPFLDRMVRLAWGQEKGIDKGIDESAVSVERVVLDTAPQFDVMGGRGPAVATAQLYERYGFRKTAQVTAVPGDAGTALNQFNLPGYWARVDARRVEARLRRLFAG